MRTCASCGRANLPTRKYCVRCGKPLLSSKMDESTKTPTRLTDRSESVEVVKPRAEPVKPVRQSPETLKVTTDDEWVRPSEVSKDRLRTTSSSKGKSEMEKAREAFARAEEIGIREEGGDIVETRMLRASDVRELMHEVATQPQTPQRPAETTPSQPMQRPLQTPREPTRPMPSKATPVGTPIEQARVQPATTPVSPSFAKSEPPRMTSAPSDTAFSPDRQSTLMQQHPQGRPPLQAASNALSAEPATISSLSKARDAPIPEMDTIRACITQPEDLLDSKIKDGITELTSLHREKQQVLADQTAIGSQLDARVRESQNKAELKRLHYESINDQMRLAKQEWDDAKEELDKADNREKRELSALDDRVKNIQKRIEKAEGAVNKRVGDLNKVREKIAQLQKQDSP